MHEQKFSFNNKLISKLFPVTGAISKLNSFFVIIIQLNRRKRGRNVFSVCHLKYILLMDLIIMPHFFSSGIPIAWNIHR